MASLLYFVTIRVYCVRHWRASHARYYRKFTNVWWETLRAHTNAGYLQRTSLVGGGVSRDKYADANSERDNGRLVWVSVCMGGLAYIDCIMFLRSCTALPHPALVSDRLNSAAGWVPRLRLERERGVSIRVYVHTIGAHTCVGWGESTHARVQVCGVWAAFCVRNGRRLNENWADRTESTRDATKRPEKMRQTERVYTHVHMLVYTHAYTHSRRRRWHALAARSLSLCSLCTKNVYTVIYYTAFTTRKSVCAFSYTLSVVEIHLHFHKYTY